MHMFDRPASQVFLGFLFVLSVATLFRTYSYLSSHLEESPSGHRDRVVNRVLSCRKLAGVVDSGFRVSVCQTDCVGYVLIKRAAKKNMKIEIDSSVQSQELDELKKQCAQEEALQLSKDAATDKFLHTLPPDHFEVKLAGPSWTALRPTPYQGGCVYKYPYELVDPGNHTLLVQHLYSSYTGVTEMYDNTPKWTIKYNDVSLVPQDSSTIPCHNPLRTEATQQRCTTGEITGRWIGVQPDKRTHFVFKPFNCVLPTLDWSTNQAQHCLKNRRIAVIGDSQQRSMYYAFRNMLMQDKIKNNPKALGGRRDHPENTNITLIFETYMWLDHEQYRTKYLTHEEPVDAMFVGMGNWPAAGSIGAQGKWGNAKYTRYIEDRAEELAKFNEKFGETVQLFWLGMPAFPHPPVDSRRNNQRVKHMVQTASRIMQKHNIAVIDTYNISEAMTHTSKDRAHYINHVTETIAAVMLNVLCLDDHK